MRESQDLWVLFLDGEDLLEEEMATHISSLAWKVTWTEEPGGLMSMGLQRAIEHTQLNNNIVSMLNFRIVIIIGGYVSVCVSCSIMSDSLPPNGL